jgi:hypothetical protein
MDIKAWTTRWEVAQHFPIEFARELLAVVIDKLYLMMTSTMVSK